MNHNRTIHTGLTGSINHTILDSVMGQLSDGKWENTGSMRKYWEHAEIDWSGAEVIIKIDDGYGSGFHGMDDAKVLNWFAGKIKQIVQDELENNYNAWWKRTDTTELSYLDSSSQKVTVADAYRAYDTMKGRNTDKLALAASRRVAKDLLVAEIAQLEMQVAKKRAELGKL